MKKSKFWNARFPKEHGGSPESYDEEWCLREVRVSDFDFGTQSSVSVNCISETGASIRYGARTTMGEMFPFSPRVIADMFRSLAFILERDFNRDGTLKEECRESYKAHFSQDHKEQIDE